MAKRPLIRTFVLKSALEALTRVPREKAEALFSCMPKNVMVNLAQAGPLAWSPIGPLADMFTEAISVLNPEGSSVFFRDAANTVFQDKMMRGAFGEVMCRYGAYAKSVLSFSPQFWELMSHNACKIKVIDENLPGFVVLRMHDLPHGFVSSDGYREAWRNSFCALLKQCQAYANIRVDVDVIGNKIDYVCSWTWDQTW